MKIIFKKKCEKLMKNMLGIETTKGYQKYMYIQKITKKVQKKQRIQQYCNKVTM